MKVAAIIFIVLGMIINFVSGVILLGLIGVGIGVWMLVTLYSNKKSIAAGVLGLLFTGLLGGIFYLCWKPDINPFV